MPRGNNLARFNQEATIEISCAFVNEFQGTPDSELKVYEMCDNDDVPSPPEEFVMIIKRFDEQTKVVTKRTEEINIGTKESPRILLISAPRILLISDELKPSERETLIALIKVYVDVFA